jgi:hypothetical protein
VYGRLVYLLIGSILGVGSATESRFAGGLGPGPSSR